MLMATDTSLKTTTQNMAQTRVEMETQDLETGHATERIVYRSFPTGLYPYLCGTASLYNQVHTDTSSR